MTTKLVILIGLMLSASCVFAQGSGTSSDDGGTGILCVARGANHNRFSLELLDLAETRIIYPGTYEHPGYKSFKVFRPEQFAEARNWLVRARARIVNIIGQNHPFVSAFDRAYDLPRHLEFTYLRDTNDSDDWQVRKGDLCEKVQLASRSKAGKVKMDVELIGFLSAKDLAALLLHESLHEYFIDLDATLGIRQAVGYTFAPDEFQFRNKIAFLKLLSERKAIPQSSFR